MLIVMILWVAIGEAIHTEPKPVSRMFLLLEPLVANPIAFKMCLKAIRLKMF